MYTYFFLQHLFYFSLVFELVVNFFLLLHYFVFDVFALNMEEYLVFYFVQRMLRYLHTRYCYADLTNSSVSVIIIHLVVQ